jgi:hypothetical protein
VGVLCRCLGANSCLGSDIRSARRHNPAADKRNVRHNHDCREDRGADRRARDDRTFDDRTFDGCTFDRCTDDLPSGSDEHRGRNARFDHRQSPTAKGDDNNDDNKDDNKDDNDGAGSRELLGPVRLR